MSDKIFTAKWIAPDNCTNLPVLRKSFNIDNSFEKVEIFISGLGIFEMHINGRKAHDTYFEPGESVYEKTVFYSAFDVTDKLQQGKNEIIVYLGGGFYHNPPTKTDRLNREPEIIGEYMLLCQLEFDGKVAVISDESWESANSQITESVWLGGETCDSRIKVVYDKNVKVIDDFPFGKLKKRIHPPVKEIKRIYPISATKLPNGNTLIDFGINFAGTYVYKGKASKGTRVNFWFGEVLNETGYVDQRGFWGKIYDKYVFSGNGIEEYSPKFVYHGFRYIEVEGIECEPDDFVGIMLHCDNEKVSEIETDNEIVNAIHKLITRSVEDNMQSVLTDCPHREKLGWTEVYHLLFSTINYNYDCKEYYKKLIYDLIDAQKENGSTPSIVPPFTRGIKTHALRNNSLDDTPNDPSWCGALIFACYEYYKFYGDKELLETAYPYMQKYLSYISSLSKDHLLPSENLNRDLGDWMSTDAPSVSFVVSCVYYRLYAVMAEIAEILCEEDGYRAEKELIKTAINGKYLHNDTYDNDSQSSICIAVAYDIADETIRKNLISRLTENVQENSYTLTVGEVALKPFFDVLCQYGYEEVAYKALIKAYGTFAKTHTTLPESWSGRYSQNHAMLGAGDSFFFEHIAGIQNVGIAFDKVELNPYFPEDMNTFSLKMKTPKGQINIHWERKDKIIFTCEHSSGIDIIFPENDENVIFNEKLLSLD